MNPNTRGNESTVSRNSVINEERAISGKKVRTQRPATHQMNHPHARPANTTQNCKAQMKGGRSWAKRLFYGSNQP